jgi:hypothetical protein
MNFKKIFLILFTLGCLSGASANETKGGAEGDNRRRGPIGPPRAVSPENVCSRGVTIVGVTETNGNSLEETTCEMPLDANFAQMLREDVPRCAKEASLKIYGRVPVNIELYQVGGYNVRKINTPANHRKKESEKTSDKWSKHSTGQALDIEGIGLNFGDDSRLTKIKFSKDSSNQPYYDAFRDCWDKTTRSTVSGKACKTCSIGHPHTHPFSNVLHNDHMHFSMDCRPPVPKDVAGC